MAEQFKLREVFNSEMVIKLADNISSVWPSFSHKSFVDTIIPNLSELSFGDRCSLIAETLHSNLPEDYPPAVQILIDALVPEAVADSPSGFNGFIVTPQCLFVSRYGMDYFDASINALYEMTKRFTAEGDVRPFIEKYPEKTMAFLHRITKDKNPYARRLASEGTRPRLPLCQRLPKFQKDPTPVIELLDKLKSDPNLMVRRSVANNLNDIAKDNPDVVVETLEKWQKEDTSKEMKWIISHSLRSIIKQGHPGALQLLGYSSNVELIVSDIDISNKKPAIGEEITFSFTITSKENKPCKLMIDYIVYNMKANRKQAPKVFKAVKKTIAPGQSISIKKKHSFIQRSTRKHYPGEHSIEIQINGKKFTKTDFVIL